MPDQTTHPKFTEDLALRKILEGTASSTGDVLFRDLVKNLAEVLGAYGAFITEYFPETNAARAIAFWTMDG